MTTLFYFGSIYDNGSMRMHRPLRDSIGDQSQYGDTVEVYFTAEDVGLPFEEIHSTWRFMEVAANGLTLPGWAPEDKIHLLSRRPTTPADRDKTFQLALDSGGDWYLEMWRTRAFDNLRPGAEFSTLPDAPYQFLTKDPSNLIALNGIRTVIFYAQAYEGSIRKLPF